MSRDSVEFSKVAERFPFPLLLITADGTLLSLNRSARKALGLSNQDVGSDLLNLLGLDRDTTLDYLRYCAGTRDPLPGRFKPAPESGKNEFVVESGLFDHEEGVPRLLVRLLQSDHADQRTNRFKVLTRDLESAVRKKHVELISEQQLHQDDVARLQSQRLESLGLMAGSIAHDFNNLLTIILGFGQLAESEIPPESTAAGYLQEIIAGATRAAGLTRQLLAYSGKGRFVQEAADLSKIVEGCCQMLEVSLPPDCELVLDLSDDLPAINCDPSQIQQVVMNLVLNAGEALVNGRGRVTIHTSHRDCDESYLKGSNMYHDVSPGRYIFMEVSDTGRGMSEETVTRVFEPFFGTKDGGHGLGLAAVYGIVTGHRGAIRVYSTPGQGTSFKILLPAAGELDRTLVDIEAEQRPEYGGGSVLIVDDDANVRRFAGALLAQRGFQTDEAENGLVAVERFRQDPGKYRFILLDMTMPVMDGKTAMAQLRETDPKVKIILSSGHNEQLAIQQYSQRGSVEFLQKPYTREQLDRVLSRLLGGESEENH